MLLIRKNVQIQIITSILDDLKWFSIVMSVWATLWSVCYRHRHSPESWNDVSLCESSSRRSITKVEAVSQTHLCSPELLCGQEGWAGLTYWSMDQTSSVTFTSQWWEQQNYWTCVWLVSSHCAAHVMIFVSPLKHQSCFSSAGRWDTKSAHESAEF